MIVPKIIFCIDNVWFQKISIPPPPTEGIGISRGVGGSKAQENPDGGGGDCINLYYFFQAGSIIPIY